jgi:transcriptional regulator with XRE-family HTH domain
MPVTNPVLLEILKRLREQRTKAGLSEAALEERLILGPGWISRFESGTTLPTLDMLLALLDQVGGSPETFFAGLKAEGSPDEVERFIHAIPDGNDLLIHFRYADHDAAYRLPNAKLEEFETVVKTLRDGLAALASRTPDAKAVKTQAVARSFLKAVQLWPHANPSDLWWFLIYRAYCDPFNHPASYARLDFSQSWKRTGGWALEEILVQFYGPFLAKNGIRMFIAHGDEKQRLLRQLKVSERLEADKVDVLLTSGKDPSAACFGVVHVKASFAERRTDDVPMSKALVDAGYVSPLWTMDCKSTPSVSPDNRGELGEPIGPTGDARSAKRKDIEDDGYFSACFSYNRNTRPTPPKQKAKARVVVCDFRSPDDEFSQFIIRSLPKRRR